MVKSVLPLSSVIAIRFLGLFIVMPTLSVYALELEYSTPVLAGVAISIYAISQMLLQTPFGILSDRIGRKKTIAFGVLVFIVGSLICGVANDIYTLLVGRFLQGAGAIGAVVVAMISDLIHEEKRTKAMALMGGSISISFTFALIFGPVIAGGSGTDVLFFISALLALLSLAILYTKVPDIPKVTYGHEKSDSTIKIALQNSNLKIMFFTGFFQKLLLTTAFVLIPYIALQNFSYEKSQLYIIYLPATLLGVFAMGFGAVFAEKKGRYKEVLIAGIVLLGASFVAFGFNSDRALFFLAVMLFFSGFSMHEPIMQSLASKYPKSSQRGAILGVFNSFSYLGTFIGGLLGGIVLYLKLPIWFFVTVVAISIIWIYMIFRLELPKKRSTIYVKTADITGNLNQIDGVVEHYENRTEGVTTIIFDDQKVDEDKIRELSTKPPK